MEQESTATFHVFSSLPLELRIQVWQSCSFTRVLKVSDFRSTYYSSPTPAPAVTRACKESRKYTSYQKSFTVHGSPRYIWVCLASDIIQMSSDLMSRLAIHDDSKKKGIRHLRLELMADGWDLSEFFFHDYSHSIRDFPNLESCDILIDDGLYNWAQFIEEGYWGTCPDSNVRIVDAKTGEWISAVTAGPYRDYLDTGHGESRDYQRIVDYWDEEEDAEERYEALMKMKAPLPRMNLE
jgi:hypothetical protein